jgi:hypothetical protein
MPQQTFAEVTFEQYRKPTRRERFLEEMTRVIPWADLAGVIAPFYPKTEGAGRPAVGRGTDAPHPFPPTLVQSVRPGGGGGPV